MIDKQCLDCGAYDSDLGCTMPFSDRWYACPLKSEDLSPDDFLYECEEADACSLPFDAWYSCLIDSINSSDDGLCNTI